MSPALASIDRYLETLPRGIASYPECTVKAAVLRNDVDPRPLGPEVPLPPEVRALLDHPPPVSVWVPEVHYNVAMLATREVHFPGAETGVFRAWVHHRNTRLLAGPLYRALFFVLSPERFLVGMEKRWGTFRRGSQLRVVSRGEGRVELSLATPPHLYPEVQVVAVAAAFQAAMEAVGVAHAQIDGAREGPSEVRFLATWG